MTKLTYFEPGTAQLNSATGDQPDNSPRGVTNTLQNLTFLFPTTEGASTFVGDFRLLNDPTSQMVFLGNRFSYSSTGVPIGGVISGWQRYFNGQLVWTIGDISVPVATLSSWVSNGQFALAGATVFAGNDTITAPHGVDVISGYGGIDIAILPDTVKEDTIIGRPISTATITGPDISDTLTSIERVQFIDGTLYYDSSSPAAQIERMYQAALGRVPDSTGLANWVAAMNGGGSLNQVAASFIGSIEFQTRFPGASQNTAAFITQLYANVLHRAPDSAGLSFWVGTLQSGVQTQAQVLTAKARKIRPIRRGPLPTVYGWPMSRPRVWLACITPP